MRRRIPADRRSRFMRQVLLFAIVLVSSAAGAFVSIGVAVEPLRIRVLSYNIHHGEGTDGKLDLERLARVIGEAQPDVVALQEVDVRTERTGNVDQAAELARLTKLHVAFGSSMNYQGGQYGNAVLSRWPVVASKVAPLPRFGDGEPRSVLVCEIDLPEREEHLPLLATHFGFHAGAHERLASVESIEGLVREFRSRPAILAGDLNDLPESAPLKRLRETWTAANEEPLPTVPVVEPTKQIDFVLFRPADRWRTVEVEVLDEAVASDHRAILAELELLPAK